MYDEMYRHYLTRYTNLSAIHLMLQNISDIPEL